MLYKYSIYAAEDDLDDHVLIREAFEENNIHANITFFQNGEELLKGLSQASELPTMVMSDLQMPAKDGFEVLMEIKKNPAWQDLPVIIFSNSNRAENIVKAYSLGATLFVVKPVTYNGKSSPEEQSCRIQEQLSGSSPLRVTSADRSSPSPG
jgi:CheY-like chemotaxis protein